MFELNELTDKVINGGALAKKDALPLITAHLNELCARADRIRAHYLPQRFDICAIINAKSGVCSEDCKFCAQSARYDTKVDYYDLMDHDTILDQAMACAQKGVKRFSIVTSGKRLRDDEIDRICAVSRDIRQNTRLGVCVSSGLTEAVQYLRLKAAGVSRVHNNLETSKRYFSEICSTHTYDEKLRSIAAARKAGLEICCGGILGLGETFEDRIDLMLTIRSIGAVSMPVNILNPIPGTPFEGRPALSYDDIRRTVAIARFILPDCDIRLAGGRSLLPDRGKACLESGANAVITGDMLTTPGPSIDADITMIRNLGFCL